MGKKILVLGGARSGKSNFALKLALKLNKRTVFLATALPTDPDMVYRIIRHQEERPFNWSTIEIYKEFDKLSTYNSFNQSEVVLIDCITLLVSNQMIDSGINWNKTKPQVVFDLEEKIKKDISSIYQNNKTYIFVSNEVGLGIVPDNMFANYFRDILGRVNIMLAQIASEVYFMVAGIPIKIKGEENEPI